MNAEVTCSAAHDKSGQKDLYYMREIKFRAWDKRTGKWIETFRVLQDGHIEVNTYTGNPLWQPYAQEHYELQQYTGLKDKNGKEIYEGDIVSYTNFYEAGGLQGSVEGDRQLTEKVEWDNNCSQWTLQTVSLGVAHLCDSEIEVIGNIYENKNVPTPSRLR